MAHRFHIVDVFAERAYSGNPLAVVVGADGLSDEAMQALAAEMNFSETTFVVAAPEGDGGYRTRIFTPSQELAFAGHPVLGTAWVMRNQLGSEASGVVRLNMAAGQVPVAFDGDVAWFLVPPIAFGPQLGAERIAPALGLSAQEIAPDAPVQQVSGGSSALIVPLRNLAALKRSRLDLEAFAPLAAEGFPPLVYLFCRETHQPGNDLCARFFFDAHGVREDPATGFGAGLLGAYLLEHGVFPGGELALRIEQGHELRRSSLVLLRARRIERDYQVSVGGRVIPIVHGALAAHTH